MRRGWAYKNLVDWWCCKRSVRYGGRPVCNALKVKVASLNCMRQSSGSQWSCLRSSLEENGVRERWFTTTLASARCTRWRRPVCFRAFIIYRPVSHNVSLELPRARGREFYPPTYYLQPPPSSYAFLLTLWVRNSPRCLYFKNTIVMPISIIQFTEPRHTVSTKRLSNISWLVHVFATWRVAWYFIDMLPIPPPNRQDRCSPPLPVLSATASSFC